jgi:dihydrodipicolinate synthase/N-acetylneuraminate lyase
MCVGRSLSRVVYTEIVSASTTSVGQGPATCQFNPALVEPLTDIPNVVAIKAYVSDGIGKWAELQHRVPIRCCWPRANLRSARFTVAHYGQQSAGAGSYTTFEGENTENPRIVRMFESFKQSEFAKGMELYSGARTHRPRTAQIMSAGWMGMKYMQWLTGGGGVYRQPTNVLTQQDKDAMRAGAGRWNCSA